MIYLNQLPTVFGQSFTASGESTHNNGGFLEGKPCVFYTLNIILVYTRLFSSFPLFPCSHVLWRGELRERHLHLPTPPPTTPCPTPTATTLTLTFSWDGRRDLPLLSLTMEAIDTPMSIATHPMVMVTMAMDARKDLQNQALTMVVIATVPGTLDTTGDSTV